MPKVTFIFLLIPYFLLSSSGVYAQSLREIDRDILETINNLDSPFIDNYSNVSSLSASVLSIGVPLSMFAYSFVENDMNLRQESLYIGTSVVVSFLASWTLKNYFTRTRPYKSHPGIIQPDNIENSYSFPSSHASVSFALATSMSLQYPKWYVIVPSYVWACSVGFSRIQKGVHYPSDVVGGAIVGACSAFFCHELNKLILKEYNKKKSTDVSWINNVYNHGAF